MSENDTAPDDLGRLRRRLAEQRDELAELHQLVDTTPDALIVVDPEGAIVLVNRQAESLFGYGRDEMVGQSIELLLPERYRQDHIGHRRYYADKPHVRPMGAGLDLRGLHRDGREIPVEISLSPIRLGGRTLFASAIRDVTARVEIEGRLREARDVAEHATQSKARFIAAASHDLRQPLQAASIYLELATNERVEREQRDEATEKAERCVRTLTALLDKVLHISRLDAGAVAAHRSAFRLQTLFDRLRDQYAPAAARKGLELRVRPSAAVAYSDAVLLQQLLENLLSNAVRYTEEGGVLVGCRRRGPFLVVQVWDTGSGIAPEDREKIFDEFRRLGGRGAEANLGIGLGLAIVRRLEAVLEHPVSLRSRPGRGTVFEVRVPAADGARADVEVSRSRARERPGGVVALVDDDREVLEAVRTVLEVAGHSVVAGASGEEILSALREASVRPDLLLTDYRLGGEATGLDVIRALRQEYSPRLPAVVLTGDSSYSTLERRAEELRFDLLAKPVVTRQLLDALARRLGGAPRGRDGDA